MCIQKEIVFVFTKIKLNEIMHENWVHENEKSRLLQIIQLFHYTIFSRALLKN